MKKEHFNYIVQKFNLTRYSKTNDMFRPNELGEMRIKGDSWSCICILNNEKIIFTWLPSRRFAREIITHIQKTEMLFV